MLQSNKKQYHYRTIERTLAVPGIRINRVNSVFTKRAYTMAATMALAALVAVGTVAYLSVGYHSQQQGIELSDSGLSPTDSGRRLFSEEQDSQIMKEYLHFLGKYQKVYASQSDSVINRYEVFRENYKNMEAHNSQEDASFLMGINEFSDLTDAEVEQTLIA